MQGLCANRVHNPPREEEASGGSRPGGARFVLHAQVEAGTLCPVTMTCRIPAVIADASRHFP